MKEETGLKSLIKNLSSTVYISKFGGSHYGVNDNFLDTSLEQLKELASEKYTKMFPLYTTYLPELIKKFMELQILKQRPFDNNHPQTIYKLEKQIDSRLHLMHKIAKRYESDTELPKKSTFIQAALDEKIKTEDAKIEAQAQNKPYKDRIANFTLIDNNNEEIGKFINKHVEKLKEHCEDEQIYSEWGHDVDNVLGKLFNIQISRFYSGVVLPANIYDELVTSEQTEVDNLMVNIEEKRSKYDSSIESDDIINRIETAFIKNQYKELTNYNNQNDDQEDNYGLTNK